MNALGYLRPAVVGLWRTPDKAAGEEVGPVTAVGRIKL